MDLLEKSKKLLFDDVYESKKMILRLLSMPANVQSKISISLIPYLSMVCDGIDSLFPLETYVSEENFPKINNKEFIKIVKEIRASSKLLTDKKNIRHSINVLDRSMEEFREELIKPYGWFRKLVISVLGQEDIGVFYKNENPFANTSQWYLYITPLNSNVLLVKKDALLFSELLSKCINAVSTIIETETFEVLQQEDSFLKVDPYKYSAKDYFYGEEKRRNIFNKCLEKRIALYLFNMQCQLNFSLYILEYLIDNHPLKYRIQLLIYYYSGQALRFAYNDFSSKIPGCLKESITNILTTHQSIFDNNSFRNNLFHYKVSSDINFALSENLFEAIIINYTSQSLEELLSVVYSEMIKMEKIIHDVIFRNRID